MLHRLSLCQCISIACALSKSFAVLSYTHPLPPSLPGAVLHLQVLWAFCSLRHWHPRLLPVLVELLRPVAAEQLDAVQAARVGNAHIAMLEIVPGMSE